MSDKLKLIDRITNETGMWFGLVGLLIAVVGAGLAFGGFHLVGYWIAVIGVVTGGVGVVMHFVMNWREIFRIDR